MGRTSAQRERQAPNDDGIVAALLNSVLALPAPLCWQFFDRLAGRIEVAVAGWRISERRDSPHPNAERDAEMVRLYDGGLSYDDIGAAYKLNPRTVARACQRFRRQQSDSKTLSPSRAA